MSRQLLLILLIGGLGITCLGLIVVAVTLFMMSSNRAEHRNVAIDVSPDGKMVVFSSADGDLFLFDLAEQNVRRLTDTAAIETTPAFSPDGQSLVYAADTDGSHGKFIFVRTLDGKRTQQLTRDPEVSDALPRYSPDGSQIVFARAHLHRPYSMGGWTWDDWDVYVMDADGGNVRRLTQKKHYGMNKTLFSRDGQTIFYSADADRGAKDLSATVFAVSVDNPQAPTPVTSRPQSAAKHAAWAFEPALSPDGKHFVFMSDRDKPGDYDLILMDRQSGECRLLGAARISPYNHIPVITPNGKTIMFLAGTEMNAHSRAIFSLWSMDIDGGNAKQVADSGLFTDPDNWKPKR